MADGSEYADEVRAMFARDYGGNGTEIDGDLLDLCYRSDIEPEAAVRLLYERYLDG